ncbi:BnaAnng15600D [Brassica napus]|uniref:BnaAnng15600D protein n=1 Tax=Brassica napus TaxID=3708 RepID=A0A078J0V9_BRANA|nr:BnaAnng15600D [Brassica napus]
MSAQRVSSHSLSTANTNTTQPEWTLGFALPLSDSRSFTWRAHVCTPCEVYEYLITGCPLLEELFIRYASPSECSWMVVNQSIAVSSPSIKRMSISYPSRDYCEPPATRLDLRRERVLAVEEDESLPDVANLVEGISNVKTLHLSPYFLEVFDICCKSMPVFHNLLTLSFESDKERGWQVVPLLLKNSPNLETLVIKGLVHQVTDKCGDACVCIAKKKKKMEEEKVCCLSTCQVKVLNISGYRGTGRELKQMRHFLGNLKCLETVKVDNSVNNHYQRITNALTKLPRASSNCQIHFF